MTNFDADRLFPYRQRYGALLVSMLRQRPLVERVIQALQHNCAFVGGTARDGLLLLLRGSSGDDLGVLAGFWTTALRYVTSPGRLANDAERDFRTLCQRGIDLATPLLPEDVVRLLKENGLAVDVTALTFGVVLTSDPHDTVEITSYRLDHDYDGRYPRVSFGASLSEDARRRDFTVNALYVHSDGVVNDPLDQGWRDLAGGVVRFIGDGAARVREDHVRSLRYFRCAADLGADLSTPHHREALAMLSSVALVQGLSPRRLRRELVAMMTCVGLDWQAVIQSGILQERAPPPDNHMPLNRLALDSWYHGYGFVSQQDALDLYVSLQPPSQRSLTKEFLFKGLRTLS